MSQSFAWLFAHLVLLPLCAFVGWCISRQWGMTRLRLWPSAPVRPSAPSSVSLPLRGPRTALLKLRPEAKAAILLLFLAGGVAAAGEADSDPIARQAAAAVFRMTSHG